MFTHAQHIFFVGIKGVAMASLTRMIVQMGKHVSGSEVDESFITDEIFVDSPVKIIHSFEAKDLPDDVDMVVYAASHGGRNNPQVVEAESRGIKVLHQSELLAQMMSMFDTSIAIAGCHGKTTTSSLLAFVLKKLTTEVSYMVGAPSFNGHFGGEYAGTQYFVVEADEYGIDPPDTIIPKFHLLHPDYAIITNIDHDHPDVYPTIEDTKKAFHIFMNQVLQKNIIMPQLILCADDTNIRELSKELPKDSYSTYGFSSKADVHITNVKTSDESMTISISSKLFELKDKQLQVDLFGEKNASNTAAVLTMLLHLGFSFEKIGEAMCGFTGAKRRFEYIGKSKKIVLFDDYAHHPEEIVATIEAARSRFPKKRVIVLFQPHTFSRTERLKTEFVQAFSKADKVVLLPIFGSAREVIREDSITSEILAQLANSSKKNSVISTESKDDALMKMESLIKQNDLVITMGAGDVYKLGKSILEIE
ncbi:MAG: UDP-N-acetylmuramate--L-alanine ligase [Candidatus Roizmanbacteria bacterium]|nr:UDP-N-acetylmuramate--L-alanine ligase [Candidatus Roizmanbacteria bacterium]